MIKYDINETGNISLNNNHIVTLSLFAAWKEENIIINNDTLCSTLQQDLARKRKKLR